ncbi:MAG TPA: N-acetylglucosamine-6-phosphate deacetylase [Chitinophagaceae bacterium]
MQSLYAANLFTGEEWLKDVTLVIEDGKIHSIEEGTNKYSKQDHSYGEHVFLAPAFIDLQIYGAANKLLAVYSTTEALDLLRQYCFEGGATLFQPTMATNTKEVFYKAIDAVRAYWEQEGKGVHGLHLEGPWINKEKKGAHVEEEIHSPTLEEVKELLDYGNGVITMITLAPEVCAQQVIDYITSKGIVISAGHSNANFEEAVHSFNNGITTITHLFNAMSPLQHRAPGLVGASFLHSKVKASCIPDGYHTDFAAITIAKQIMKERLFVITDAVTETNEGYYQHHLVGDKYECNGTLSGSALTMHSAFLNLVERAGIEKEEALRMCSLYPAQVIQMDHLYGKIAPGYQAQFVVLNKQLRLVDTIVL